jgi:predicted nuclease with TOPRIM domain
MADEVTLKEHVESLFQALGERLDTYMGVHVTEHQALAQQVDRDAATVNQRLEEMNNLRTQISSERGQFATRDLLDSRVQALSERLEEMSKGINLRFEEMNKRMADAERARANLDGRFAMVGMLLLGSSIIINVVISIISRSLTGHL